MRFIVFLIITFIYEPVNASLIDQGANNSAAATINGNCVKYHCFHQLESECPPVEHKCRCRQLPSCRRAAICCNVNKFQLTEGLACANISTLHGFVEALHIRNATLDVLNVSLPSWRRLRYMTITNGRIESVIGEFGKHSIVSCLNLSANHIVNFDDRALVNLYNLSVLDLSHNKLSEVPRFKKEGNVVLDISNNTSLHCISLFETLKRSDQLAFNNENTTACLSSRTFHWFNSTEYVPLSQVVSVHELRTDCLPNCSCEPHRMDIIAGKPPIFAVAVNCSEQQLTQLPTPLPPNTSYLNVSNNNITSLEALSTDSSYQSLRELYADSNQINSILPLEGSKFMSNFVVLSLKNNKIRSIPTYIFSNNFDRNSNYRHIFLGNNRLNCDCNTARTLKVWLLTKQKHVPDYDDIFCDNNANTKVWQLNSLNYCRTKQDWSDYIYYIITAEVLLLAGLISKVCYDYWIFKTSGYLPWPANKMPKLPCDWLCE